MPKRPREYKQWMKDPNPKEPKQTKHSRKKRQQKIAEQGQNAAVCPQIGAQVVNIDCTSAESIYLLETSTCGNSQRNNEELIFSEEINRNSTSCINGIPQSCSLLEDVWNEVNKHLDIYYYERNANFPQIK
ncbi:uncharacterized protein LOC143902261 isoform X1 [Temnothorax americanus]|uniref:uncharacterized protein LOC143895552 isoform X2 n=1 Tax=Temnothorax americanus TaxID=1964332 RepID=UPI0040678C62